MTSGPSTAAPILAVLAVVLVTLGAYVGGYYWLGERYSIYTHDNFELPPGRIERDYPHVWLRTIYLPAARVEAWLTGIDVGATCGKVGAIP